MEQSIGTSKVRDVHGRLITVGRAILVGSAAAALALGGLFAGAISANATPPAEGGSSATTSINTAITSLPVGEFEATACLGSTNIDPATGQGSTPWGKSALLVSGERLTNFNDGHVVVLYDNTGSTNSGGTPLCAVRFVEGVGAVSTWMYCTDLGKDSCGRTGRDGELLAGNGTELKPLENLDTNPKLSADDELLISWIVTHGFTDRSGTHHAATIDSSTDSRYKVSQAVWCISDGAGGSNCRANTFPDGWQESTLEEMRSEAKLELTSPDQGAHLQVGQTTSFTIETNLLNRPLDVQVEGAEPGDLHVVNGAATIADGKLTVTESPVTFEYTPTSETGFTVGVEALVPRPDEINWHQSPGGVARSFGCQIFSTFDSVAPTQLAAAVEVGFEAVPEETPTVTPTTPASVPPAESTPPTSSTPPAAAPPTEATPTASATIPPAVPTTTTPNESLATTGGTFEGAPFLVGTIAALGAGFALVLVARRRRAGQADSE